MLSDRVEGVLIVHGIHHTHHVGLQSHWKLRSKTSWNPFTPCQVQLPTVHQSAQGWSNPLCRLAPCPRNKQREYLCITLSTRDRLSHVFVTFSGVRSPGMVISSALAGTSIGNSSDTKERMREVFPTFLSWQI